MRLFCGFSNCRSTRRIYFERTKVLSSYSFLEILHANSSLLVAGPICSILVNRFGCRPVMMVGGLFASLGMIMASFATNIIHIYLCTGVITGEYCFVITYEILGVHNFNVLTPSKYVLQVWDLLWTFSHPSSCWTDISVRKGPWPMGWLQLEVPWLCAVCLLLVRFFNTSMVGVEAS